MPILNYTTTIAADKTLGEIQTILARHDASSILIEYANRQPVAVSFLAPTNHGPRGFRLPANVDAVAEVLERQARAGQVPKRFANREQAARVAWRIVKDWLEAQMAIIEAGMVTLDEVMLPYLTEPDGRTLYQVMTERRLALPPAGEDGGS
jgi:hypothetical protein